jgi:transposase InsO family protein
VQYASRRYRERLAEAGIRGSMSRIGNPYDNAKVEGLIKTLKHEEVYLHDYATVQDANRPTSLLPRRGLQPETPALRPGLPTP